MTTDTLRTETLRLAQRLIRFESIAGAPEQIAACIETIRSYLDEGSLVVRRHESGGVPSLAVTFAETEHPRVFLNGHIDVVPGRPEQFEPRIEGDRLYGRGAIDMKAAVAAMVVLVRDLAQRGERPDLGLMIVGDEEIGGAHGTAHLIEVGYGGEFFLAGEPTWLKIGNRAKGVARAELVARGRPAHAARPWEGEGAIDVMMEAYPCLRQVFPFPGDDRHALTASLTIIRGGDAANRLPTECRLLMDIRYPKKEDLMDRVGQIRAAFPSFGIEFSAWADPVATREDDPFVVALGEALTAVLGEPPAFLFKDAASDARFFAGRGTSAVVFGPAGDGGHGDAEWVDLDSLYSFQRVLERFVGVTC
ncbi:MAG: M20/M25/M40 family metallo-hydrolase [Ardenticatenaceae bacterium]|nr:M20/M25/M40 family metallo-hydrolase [Ardenticatenaceae bacterium]